MHIDEFAVSRRRALLTGAGVMAGLAGLGGSPAVSFAEHEDRKHKAKLPVKEIEAILHMKGKMEKGVLSINLDREDLTVTGPMGVPFKPSFELVHEFYFQALGPNRAILNAEFTFTQSERQKTLETIIASGLIIQAQHQHFIGESPQTWHYHFRGVGDPRHLAHACVNVIKSTGTPFPQTAPSNPKTPLPVTEIARILRGTADVASAGVVNVTVDRRDHIKLGGHHISPDLNIAQTIAFEPLDSSGKMAAAAPDYAMTSKEVQRTLRRGILEGFQVHCLYNQETAEKPQLFFSHQLAVGAPLDLARRIRRVINETNSEGSPHRHGQD